MKIRSESKKLIPFEEAKGGEVVCSSELADRFSLWLKLKKPVGEFSAVNIFSGEPGGFAPQENVYIVNGYFKLDYEALERKMCT